MMAMNIEASTNRLQRDHVHSVSPFDQARVRGEFPSLATGETYLDSAASSLTPDPVLRRMESYYRSFRANVNRGIYRSSMAASEEYERSCATIARFVGADPDELVITANATTALNLLGLSLELSPGDGVVVRSID